MEVSGVSTATEAQAACRLEQGNDHPEDSTFICEGWDAVKISVDFFRVTFQFVARDTGQNSRPTRIQWEVGLASELFDRDVDGNPVTNSARDPFEDGIQIEVPDIFFSVIRFERPPFNVARALSFIGTVNDGPCKVYGNQIDDGQCFCRHIGPMAEYTLSANWIEVAYRFQLRKQGFDARILDQGLRSWFRDTRIKLRRLTEIFHPTGTVTDGNPSPRPVQISSAVRLNGKGKPIEDSLVNRSDQPLVELDGPPAGATIDTTPGGIAVFLKYKKYPRSKFQNLGL